MAILHFHTCHPSQCAKAQPVSYLQSLHHEAECKLKQAANLQQQAEGKRIQAMRSRAADTCTDKERQAIHDNLMKEAAGVRVQADTLQADADRCLADAGAVVEMEACSRVTHTFHQKKLALIRQGVQASEDALAACMTILESFKELSNHKEKVCCCQLLLLLLLLLHHMRNLYDDLV
jgi:hypothetical protein